MPALLKGRTKQLPHIQRADCAHYGVGEPKSTRCSEQAVADLPAQIETTQLPARMREHTFRWSARESTCSACINLEKAQCTRTTGIAIHKVAKRRRATRRVPVRVRALVPRPYLTPLQRLQAQARTNRANVARTQQAGFDTVGKDDEVEWPTTKKGISVKLTTTICMTTRHAKCKIKQPAMSAAGQQVC